MLQKRLPCCVLWMRSPYQIVVAILLLTLRLSAGDTVPNADEAFAAFKQFISSQQSVLSNIGSLTYTAVSTYKAEPDFVQAAGDRSETTCNYTFSEQGDKWIYNVDVSGKSGTYISEELAFDGESYAQLFKLDGIFKVTKKHRLKGDYNLANKTYLFDPIKFIPQEIIQNSNFPLTLAQFASQENWYSLLKRAANVHFLANQESDKEISFEVPGGLDIHSKKPFTYEVVCSKKYSYYPVTWKMLDAEKHVLAEYTVLTMAQIVDGKNGGAFYYPKSAQIKRYTDEGKLVGTTNNVISSVSANGKLDDDVFTIDPSQARLIRDMDNQTTIEVPK